MHKVRVPISVDPVKSAGKQLSYLGLIPGKNLVRWQELLVEACPDIAAQIHFEVDEQGIKVIRGHAEASVVVACERCGEPMTLAVQCDFVYAPITKRQKATDMPEGYEPIDLNELGEVNLHELVEDELMLTMPVVPKHDEHECRIKADAMQWGELDPSAEAKENPFAVLQALKHK